MACGGLEWGSATSGDLLHGAGTGTIGGGQNAMAELGGRLQYMSCM